MFKKMLQSKKGLTLVELLAVIVVLGIISAIAIPAIGGVIEKSKVNADLATLKLIEDAAIRYATTENVGNVGVTNKAIAAELVTKGYLANFKPALQSKSLTFTNFSVAHSAGTYTVTVYSDAGTTVITEAIINPTTP